MKYFGINFFCDYKQHSDAIWAVGRYELEKEILAKYPKATGILYLAFVSLQLKPRVYPNLPGVY